MVIKMQHKGNDTMKDLALLENINSETAPKIIEQQLLDALFEKVKSETITEVTDVSTAENRKRISELAMKVSRSKTAVLNPLQAWIKDIKQYPVTVTKVVKSFEQKMNDLRDEVKKPLTDWQQAEEDRVNKHQSKIEEIKKIGETADSLITSMTISGWKDFLSELEALKIDSSFEEFQPEALEAKKVSVEKIKNRIARQQKEETQEAEMQRLRRLEKEKIERDRELEIRAHAEAKAKKESEESIALKEREHKLALERAEKEKLEADERAKQAAANERKRIEEEQRKAQEEALRKASDVAHREDIESQTVKDLVTLVGMLEGHARRLVESIKKGEISNITINY